MKLVRFACATALAGSMVLLPVYAAAQQTTPSAAQTPADDSPTQDNVATDPNVTEAAAQEGGDILVTGSRLQRPNLESSNPITSVTLQDIKLGGNVSLGDSLNALPALRSTYSQANSTRFIGTAGLNLLDLRGLGPSRTLVVVNGRRHITSQPGNFNVDVNTIPQDLIERVDVLTGGSSAVYGSDAMAGVVNFVLKRDFEGIRLSGQGGVSSRGDRGSYFGALTAGKNFSEGRGNITAALEYSRQNVLYYTDRDELTGAYSGRSQFNAVQNTGPNLNPNAGAIRTTPESSLGDGIPDQAYLRGVRNNTISEGGLFTASCPTVAAAGESAAAFAARRSVACSGLANIGSANTLSQYGRTFVFNPDGTLTANNCITDLRPFGSGNCVGGQGSTLRLTGMLQPQLERYSANVVAHYDFAEAFKPFVEAKYVRIDALQEGQPTFFNNTFSINNPFLTSQARAQLVSALAPGATGFSAQRFNVDFGARGEEHRRDIYRVVAGVQGDFWQDWNYEVAANYGHLDTFYRTNGNVITARYNNSINAVRNAQGQIVCGINADASTTNDDAACVPVNLFGNAQPSQAALNYFVYDSTRKEKATQFDATAFVGGGLFSLPGGRVKFALGGEYRRETAYAKYDDLTASGATFLNTIPTFDPPAYEIKEVFGELNVPILRDRPFFQDLTLEASGRYSHYNLGKTGGVFAWNAGGIWAPVSDFRIRGGYARSVRAPTLGDLYTSNTQTFANGLSDPCSQANINNNPNRVRNCAAAGVPTTQTFNGTTEPFTNSAASGVSGFNRGNADLREETSNSWNFGTVIQPQDIPGLQISVDYYNVTVKNAIFSLGGQTIINQCYDNPGGIDNPFCAVVFRNANGTFAGQQNVLHGGGTVSFPITGPAFFSQPFNYAKLETSGVDIDISYRLNLGGDNRLSVRGLASYVAKRNGFTDITTPTFRDRYKSELGDPTWKGQISANLDLGKVNFDYRVSYIGKQTIATYETQNAFDGRPAQNPDSLPQVYYPDVFYHTIRIAVDVTDKYRFYVGVNNITDRMPPLGLIGTAAGDPFDNVGRFFSAGFEARF